ncbi:hypothetical protein DER46DRAFT_644962 [Fusarium sp. MPI-SDFR-AT-0072]|nr:hypothetical protein DER46DRAFT_644962 [Fusarium sp. MPI-SDFR-AT-0072]
MPLQLAKDLAGTVVLAPDNCGFKPGAEIYARIEANRPGAAAEYVLPRVSELASRPKSLSWAATAACPTSNSRVRLLINGAAGGVGSWTVQIARLAGIESIAAIVGTQSIDFIQQLGETEVIDYKKQTIGEWVAEYPEFRQYDLVLDYIGKPDVAQTWYAVREGGTLIAISFAPEDIRPNDVKKQANAFLFIIDLMSLKKHGIRLKVAEPKEKSW